MNDGVLVEALRARDPGALAALYDTYAESIYRYCRMMLGGPDNAQVALRDTLIAAEALVGALADHESFRPWLYALARGECRRRRTPDVSPVDRRSEQPGDQSNDRVGERTGTAQAAPSTMPFDAARSGAAQFDGAQFDAGLRDPGDVTGPMGPAGVAVADLRVVAQGAVSALSLADREVLDLTTRHDLSTAEVAAMLGAGQRYVEGLRESATDRLRDAITAEILARKNDHDCDRAAKMLTGFSGVLAAETRHRLIRHLARCETCSRHRMRQVSATKVFAQLPETGLPDTLRVRVLSSFVDPELVPYRRFVAKRVGALDPSGFPRAGTRREGRLAQAVAGAVATVAAAAAIALVFAQFSGDLSDSVSDIAARRWPVADGSATGLSPGTAQPDPEAVAQRPPRTPEERSPEDRSPEARSPGGRAQPQPGRPNLAEPVIPVIPAGPAPLPAPVPRPAPPPTAPRPKPKPRPVPTAEPSGPKPTPPGGEPGETPSIPSPEPPTRPPSGGPPPHWPGHHPPPHRPGPWPGHGHWPGRDHQHHRWPCHHCDEKPRPRPTPRPSARPSPRPSPEQSGRPSHRHPTASGRWFHRSGADRSGAARESMDDRRRPQAKPSPPSRSSRSSRPSGPAAGSASESAQRPLPEPTSQPATPSDPPSAPPPAPQTASQQDA
ncbi:RNA polymerase sigma factor [Sphaerimonospora mesophila]|uniref:RNA polymerase sigma factor n=1 Tax=Sphaerimonospora mesophila TaxID=37483 RepID=UPI000A7B9237